MAGVLARIGGSTKSLITEVKSLGFSAYGGNTYGSSYGGGSMPGYGFHLNSQLPGSQYDDRTAAGVLWENPAAAACFVALTKAFAQARPFLEKRVKDDGSEWERTEHPLIDLLERPNEAFSGEKLFGVTLISTMANGAAFWYFERDGKGDVREIWYEPPVGLGPTGIAPNWDKETFIKNYVRTVDGKRQELDKKDVVYFRHGLNVTNPRMPWGPLSLGSREIGALNNASSYTSALLRNHGAPAGFISLENQGVNSEQPTPEQAESLKAHVENKFGGPHNAGKTFVSNFAFKWNKVGMNPNELALDELINMPLAVVCALLGVPRNVALLEMGQPTYENYDASNRWFWDNTVIPLEDSFADEIETQMFPAFGLDPAEYRIAWDRSKVPALQEDEKAKHLMLDSSYKAGWMKRSEVRHLAGLESEPDDEVYISGGGGEATEDAPPVAAKSLNALLAESEAEYKATYNKGDWITLNGAHVQVGGALHEKIFGKDGGGKGVAPPPTNGESYIGAAPKHSWNRIGGKGEAGSYFSSDDDNENYNQSHRAKQKGYHKMSFAPSDQVFHFDAKTNPTGPGEDAFALLATPSDRAFRRIIERNDPDDVSGNDLLYMDAVVALRAKEKGLAGLVSYSGGKIGEAVDLRQHSVEELQGLVHGLISGKRKSGRKSFTDEEIAELEAGGDAALKALAFGKLAP